VSPAHPAATDTGAGMATAPYKTLSYAIGQLALGDTLLISSGVYRETMDFRQAPALRIPIGTTTPVTLIRAATGATVMIKGSDIVQGWEWVRPNLFAKRNWTVNSQQVFIDGVPLKQMGGTIYYDYPDNPNNAYAHILAGSGGIWSGRIDGNEDTLIDNSFYYDAAAQTLYVQVPLNTLSDHMIEVSTRTYAIFGADMHDLFIGSIQVAHSNTTATVQNGAITLVGARITLDHVDVKDADGAGLDITGNNNIVRNSSATACGQIGIKMRGNYSQLLNTTIAYNNTRGFNKWWEAGGAKFVGAGGLKYSVLAGNRVFFNTGDGLWFDTDNNNNKIRDNSIAYNTGMGVHYEASQTAVISRNRIFGNGQRGIYLPNSLNSVIANNLVINNGLEGIAIVDVRGATAQGIATLIPVGNYVAANVLGWNGKSALVLPGDGVEAESEANLFLGLSLPTFALGWPTPTNPIFDGLPPWLTATAHDIDSWYVQMAIPPLLATQLQQQVTSPDFSAINAVAASYNVVLGRLPTPTPAGIGTIPGP